MSKQVRDVVSDVLGVTRKRQDGYDRERAPLNKPGHERAFTTLPASKLTGQPTPDQPPAKHEEYRGEGMMQVAMNTLYQCQGQKISGTYEYVSTRPYQRARLLVPQHLSPPLLLPTRVPVRLAVRSRRKAYPVPGAKPRLV